RLVDDRLGHAMGAEDRDGAVGDLVQFLDENCTHALEALDDMTVVHDFVPHIDRRTELLEGAFDDLDRTHDASTEASRLSQDNAHSRSTPRSHERMSAFAGGIAREATRPTSDKRTH